MTKLKKILIIMIVTFILLILKGILSMAAYTQGDMLDERFSNASSILLDRSTLLESNVRENLEAELLADGMSFTATITPSVANIEKGAISTVTLKVTGSTDKSWSYDVEATSSDRNYVSVLNANQKPVGIVYKTATSLNPRLYIDFKGINYKSGNKIYIKVGKSNAYITKTLTVNVIKQITQITLTPTSMNLKKGQTGKITATILPTDSTSKTLSWTSSNTAVAQVSGGTVTAISEGEAKITAKATDGSNKNASCLIKVTAEVVPTKVSLNKTSTTLIIGKEETLTATITPTNAANKAVTWRSTDTKVVTVTNGKIKAVSPGTATIIVKTVAGGKEASCAVTVTKPPISSLVLRGTSPDVKVGDTYILTAEIQPSNANRSMSWYILNDGSAIWNPIQNNELVDVTYNTDYTIATFTCKKTGSFRIKVVDTISGKEAITSLITIKPKSTTPSDDPKISPTGISLSQSSIVSSIGITGMLQATVTPSNATYSGIDWSVGDSNILTLAKSTTDSRLATYTTKNVGNTTITATITGTSIKATCQVNVLADPGDGAVIGVTLNKTSTAIAVGKVEKLIATVEPSTATNKTIIWTSSNTSIATVDQTGNVTAKKAGTATITATSASDSTKSASCTVTAMGITVAPTAVTLAKGNTQQLTATPILAQTMTDKTVKWTSGAPLIVEVDQTGKVTAKGVGTAVVTAIANADSNVKGSCTITVTEIPTAVTVTPAETYIIIDPETNTYPTLNLKATVTPTNASQEVTWINGNEILGIASIAQTGVVTPIKSGDIKIFAATKYNENNNDTNKRKLGSCLLHVGTEVESISIKSDATLSVGAIETLKAEITPTGATNKRVKWTSSDESIATVDANGNIKAMKAGIVKITATSYIGEKTSTCAVTVTEPIVGVTLDKKELGLLVGEVQALNATVFPKNTNEEKLIWQSRNEKIATVNEKGEVTGIAPGRTTIVVMSLTDKTKNAECIVTVKLVESPVESDEYVVTEEEVLKILPDTPKQDFVNKIRTDNKPVKIRPKDSTTEITTTETINTGMKLEIDGKTYTLVVTGDINGDGKCSLIDLSILKLYTVSAKNITGEYLLAADINGNGQTDLPDLSIMKLYTVGLRKLQ